MTNVVSFITDMVSILELSSNRVPHQKLRKFAQGGGEFCSRISSYLSADDLEVLENTIETIGCSESFLCGEKGVNVCRKLLHIIEVLLKRISILESEKNEIELFLEDILINMSMREEMDNSEITMELLIEQNTALRDELTNLKSTVSEEDKCERIDPDVSTQRQSSNLFNKYIEETKLLTMALINNTMSIEHSVQVSHCGGLFRVERILDGEMFQQWSHYTKEQSFCGETLLTLYENSLSLVLSKFSETCEIVKCKHGLLWLLLIVNDDTVQEVFLQCKNIIPSVNFCVRDMSFSNSNYELLFDIPDNVVLPYVDGSNAPSFLSTNKHVIGYTYGPYFDGTQWTSESALWIFSKYGGFIDYVEDERLPEYCHIFESKREKIANYEATNEQTGLFCGLRMWKNVGYMGESALTMGPSIRLTRNNETIEGILTALHSVADDGSPDILTNGDNIYYRMEKSIEKSDSIKIPDRKACIAGRVFTSFDSYKVLVLQSEKYICNDFAIVERSIENGLKIGIPNKGGNIATETISSIEAISSSTSNSLVRIYKNGHKTGNKRGIFVNNVKMYENMSVRPITKNFDVNGIATIKFCSYILIFNSSNDFAEKGDSGSLCYLMNKDTKNGVGLLIERVCERLFLAIPLVDIAEYFETEGYNVEWIL
jgi:hypothetical protein